MYKIKEKTLKICCRHDNNA